MSIEDGKKLEPGETEVKNWYAKESWFKGYKDGNLLMPQNFFGIRLFVSESLLRDKPENPDQFARSILSPAQVEQLRKIAESVHNKRNILVYFDDTRLQSLWSTAVTQVKGSIEHLLSKEASVLTPAEFNSLLNTPQADKLKNLLTKIVNIYKSNHELKEKLKQYHSHLSIENVAMTSPTRRQPYVRDAHAIIRETLAENGIMESDEEVKKYLDHFLPVSDHPL